MRTALWWLWGVCVWGGGGGGGAGGGPCYSGVQPAVENLGFPEDRKVGSREDQRGLLSTCCCMRLRTRGPLWLLLKTGQ